MRSKFTQLCTWLGWTILAVGAMGCHSDTEFRQFDTITVSLDDSLRDSRNNLPRVEVDLIGVNGADLPVWKKTPVPQYFHSQHQGTTTVVMTLGEGQKSQSVSLNDPDPAKKKEAQRIWKEWEAGKDTYLVVLSDYPPPVAGVQPDDDPRRAVVPLMYGRWPNSQKEIVLKVTPLGLSVVTPPLPPPN